MAFKSIFYVVFILANIGQYLYIIFEALMRQSQGELLIDREKQLRVYGYCEKCEAPIFLHIDIDRDAYKVRSLRCWNGHYKEFTTIKISEVLEPEEDIRVVATVQFFEME